MYHIVREQKSNCHHRRTRRYERRRRWVEPPVPPLSNFQLADLEFFAVNLDRTYFVRECDDSLQEIVAYLKDRHRLRSIGDRFPLMFVDKAGWPKTWFVASRIDRLRGIVVRAYVSTGCYPYGDEDCKRFFARVGYDYARSDFKIHAATDDDCAEFFAAASGKLKDVWNHESDCFHTRQFLDLESLMVEVVGAQ